MLSGLSRLLLVRDNEKQAVTYFFVLYAMLGCGIAFGRNSTDVLFFKRFGIEYLPLMYVAFSFFLALVSVVYAAFADRVAPERLAILLFGTLTVLLVVNWVWIGMGDSGGAYPAYFLLYEVASELLIVHSAHYLSQNFNSLQSKRLFPLVMAGTQVGIILGSVIIAFIAEHVRIQEILLVWGGLLGLSMFLIWSWHRRHGVSAYFRPLHKSGDQLKQAVSQVSYGVTLIRSSQMLRAASLALFFMVITFYILCYSVNRIYTQTFESEGELSAFLGTLTACTNGVALLLQIFVTSRVIHRFGVKKINLFFPVTSLVSYAALLSSFSLVPAIIGSINKDAIMPAFRNPVRTIFFNTLPENVQGRARATSVVIVLPLALFVCGLMLILLQKAGAERLFLVLGLCTALAYLFFNHRMNQAYVRELVSTLRSKVLMPTVATVSRGDADELAGRAELSRNGAAAKLFSVLMDSYPDRGHELLARYADQSEEDITEQLVQILRPLNPQGFSDVLWELYRDRDDVELRALALTTLLLQQDGRVMGALPKLLQSPEPTLRVAAIAGALNQVDPVLRSEAVRRWEELLASGDIAQQLPSLGLLQYLRLVPDFHLRLLPAYRRIIPDLLERGGDRQQQRVLASLQYWPRLQFPELAPMLERIYDQSGSLRRVLCVKCARLTYESDQSLLQKAIEDSNPLVRKEAARVHFDMGGEDAGDVMMIWLSTEANGSPLAQKACLELLHELSLDCARLEQIALDKAALAQHFFVAHNILHKQGDQGCSAFELVKHILKERTRQYIELAVYAIHGFDKGEDTRLLSACINSRDPRHIANACEVLRNFQHRHLGHILSDLVDNKPIRFSELRDPRFVDSVPGVLSWCTDLPDPWLSMCAKQALKSAAQVNV